MNILFLIIGLTIGIFVGILIPKLMPSDVKISSRDLKEIENENERLTIELRVYEEKILRKNKIIAELKKDLILKDE